MRIFAARAVPIRRPRGLEVCTVGAIRSERGERGGGESGLQAFKRSANMLRAALRGVEAVEVVEAQGKARARVKAAVRRLEVVAAVLAVLAATARPQSAVHAGLVRTLIHPSLSLARGMVEVTLSQT